MEYLRIKQTIIDQRAELENFARDENLIPRENLKIYGPLLDSTQIKVITGPRRAGKSVFCLQLLQGEVSFSHSLREVDIFAHRNECPAQSPDR